LPLIINHISEKNGRLGVWHITEEADFFMEKRAFSEVEQAELAPQKGQRRLEWLAVRHLLGELTGETTHLVKDKFGKPFLQDSDYQISLSHTKDWVAAIVSPKPVGIDIQVLTPKLEGMAWRVMNTEKFNSLDPNNRLAHLHVYWGAKEALYKAWGKRDLHFKDNIIITPFDYAQFVDNQHLIQRVTEGSIRKENFEKRYDIYFSKIGHNILVYCLEQFPV
jgi:4'-phosphopantetheinyl transferase